MQSDFEKIEKIEEILVRNRGFITSAQVTEAGIPRRCVTALTEAGRVYKVDRGIYALPEFWEDDFLILQYRFSKGIYSHETALFLHAMTDRTPSSYTMTFPKSYNSGNVRAKNIKVRYSMPENYELGLCELLSPSKNPMQLKAFIKSKAKEKHISAQLELYALRDNLIMFFLMVIEVN